MNNKMTKVLEENLTQIKKELDERHNNLKTSMGSGYKKLSTKLKSELLSNLAETSIEECVVDMIAPLADNKSDLLFELNKTLEIKTTAGTDSWRGGEISKRPGDYLMVGWEEVNGELKLFIIHTYLEESDWKSSGSNNYYATSMSLTYIVENLPYKIIKGSLNKKRIKTHMVKAG